MGILHSKYYKKCYDTVKITLYRRFNINIKSGINREEENMNNDVLLNHYDHFIWS